MKLDNLNLPSIKYVSEVVLLAAMVEVTYGEMTALLTLIVSFQLLLIGIIAVVCCCRENYSNSPPKTETEVFQNILHNVYNQKRVALGLPI